MVVVPCYNVEHVVEKCIDALLAQDYPQAKFQIIIVDDRSTDKTAKIIKKYTGKEQIKIIHHLKNRGLAAARNSGIKAGKSQIVGFLDSDMVVKKQWTKAMVNILKSEKVIACMGGIKLADTITPTKLDSFLYNPKRGVLKHGENKPVKFKWFLLNNSAVKRYAINEVGYFDETITTYGGEDTDFAIRLWDKYPTGLRFTFNATGAHYHQRPLDELIEKMELYGSTNYPRLLKRYPQHNKALAGDWINTFKGKLVFNPVSNVVIKIIYLLFPFPQLIRYFIAYSLMRGARNPKS